MRETFDAESADAGNFPEEGFPVLGKPVTIIMIEDDEGHALLSSAASAEPCFKRARAVYQWR